MYLALLLLGFYLGGAFASLSERQARWTPPLEALDVLTSLLWPLLPIGGLVHGGYGWAHEVAGVHKKERYVLALEKLTSDGRAVVAAQLTAMEELQEFSRKQAEGIDFLGSRVQELEKALDALDGEDDDQWDTLAAVDEHDEHRAAAFDLQWFAEQTADEVAGLSETNSGKIVSLCFELSAPHPELAFAAGTRWFRARLDDKGATYTIVFDDGPDYAVVAREAWESEPPRAIHVFAQPRHVAEALLDMKSRGRWESEQSAFELLDMGCGSLGEPCPYPSSPWPLRAQRSSC